MNFGCAFEDCIALAGANRFVPKHVVWAGRILGNAVALASGKVGNLNSLCAAGLLGALANAGLSVPEGYVRIASSDVWALARTGSSVPSKRRCAF